MADIKCGPATVVFCHESERWVGLSRRVVVAGTAEYRAPTFNTYAAAKRYAEQMATEITRLQRPNR